MRASEEEKNRLRELFELMYKKTRHSAPGSLAKLGELRIRVENQTDSSEKPEKLNGLLAKGVELSEAVFEWREIDAVGEPKS